MSDEDTSERIEIWILAEPASAEIKVERSRFIAEAVPAASEAEARAHAEGVAKRYHDCRHVAHAWRCGHGPQLREGRADGGEPAGTAGEPILSALRAAGVTDAAVAVARYFGGVKLGTGGLARAYGEAAAGAIAGAGRRRFVAGGEHLLEFDYPQQKSLQHLLAQHGGRIESEQYGARVCWRIWLPGATVDAFAVGLNEITRGEVQLKSST